MAALTALQGLYLSYSQVENIQPLTALTALRDLNLAGTRVADRDPNLLLLPRNCRIIGKQRPVALTPRSEGSSSSSISSSSPSTPSSAIKKIVTDNHRRVGAKAAWDHCDKIAVSAVAVIIGGAALGVAGYALVKNFQKNQIRVRKSQ